MDLRACNLISNCWCVDPSQALRLLGDPIQGEDCWHVDASQAPRFLSRGSRSAVEALAWIYALAIGVLGWDLCARSPSLVLDLRASSRSAA